MTEQETISFNQKNVYTGTSPKGYGRAYFAKKDFNVGDKIMMGFGNVIDHQTAHMSVQIGMQKHYKPSKWTGKYWNHSCNPNTYTKTRADGFPNLIALKKIKKGEEITFAYYMSEYEWIKNADENYMKCKCGEKNCKGKILSFSQLSEKEQKYLKSKGYCSAYLLA